MNATDSLLKREIFHLVFLRAFVRSIPPSAFALKGGCNLRFFFGSIRYSEDMDLDVMGVPVSKLRDNVMSILGSSGLIDTLRTYGIERVQPPNVSTAKQTETVQRFKVHLDTTAGEDLLTKIEFSRRGLDAPIRSETISPSVLAAYKLPPLIVPHYAAVATVRQKARALATRTEPQPRDIFDLYILSSHPDLLALKLKKEISRKAVREARERIFELEYEQYRDMVVSFLSLEDREAYDSREVWDQIRLSVISLLERFSGG